MGRSILSFTGILILGFGLLLLNAVSARLLGGAYVDLTQEGLYTLSPGTRRILQKISDPVTIKAYISKTEASKYPAIKLYGDRVLSLLREYERVGSGKLKIEVYDPRPDTEEESWAQKFGLSPLQLPSGEKVFFGMAGVNSHGDEEVIPIFSLARQEYLEYDITRVVSSLGTTDKPIIGLVSSLRIEGMNMPPQMAGMMGRMPNSDPWVLMNQLSKLGEVRVLNPELAQIDPAVKLLVVIHPKNLSPKTLYAIDQFVLRGGNLFVAVDPYCNADQPDPNNPGAAASAERSSSLNALLSKWGVELVEKKVVGDSNLATSVRASEDSGPEDFVMWVSVDGRKAENVETVDRNDVISAQLEQILLPWPGALVRKDAPNVTFTPLFQTTRDSMLFGEEDYRFGGGNPALLLEKFLPGGKPQILAARLDGKFQSNFSAPPEGVPAPPADRPHVNESVDQSHVLVVADVDFLADYASVSVQNFLGTKMVNLLNDNLIFAGNAVENLLGSNDLITLRSRGQFTRPFTRVREIERAAEEKWHNEELTLQASLNAANQRLSQIQAGTEKREDGEQVISKALLDEVKQFRNQRAEAQRRLREVRRNLRQDKESLGQWLFVLNTFAVPSLLILGALAWRIQKRRDRKHGS